MRTRTLALLLTLPIFAALAQPAVAAPRKASLGFSSGSYSVAENAGTFNVQVLRTGNTRTAVSVNLSVDPAGTTAAPSDYSVSAGTLNFAANETSKTIPVTIVDNSTSNPPNKKIAFKLAGGSTGTQIKRATATLTIIDNEGPGTLDFDSNSYTVVEGAGLATLTVNRIGATNLRLSVDYSTAAASSNPATPTLDYTAIPAFPASTLVFEPGEVTKTIQVPITDDSNAEGPENFNVVLSNPQNLTAGPAPQIGPNSPTTVTINDDDVSTYGFDSTLFSVNEGDGQATITVDRGGATNLASSVGYSTSDGTATAGSDYTTTTGTLNFAAGETQKTFTIPITDDQADEPNETVNLSLTAGDTSTLSIVDNDASNESVQFSNTSYTVTECACNAQVTVTLSHALSQDVTVKFTAGTTGTATAGSDYTAVTNQTVTFTAGQTSQVVNVPILQDTDAEDPETIPLSLSAAGPNPPLLLGAPSTATLTINDDDPTGDLEFATLGYDVNEKDGQGSVLVHRVGGSAGTVTVDYETSDGTAKAGKDYTATSGTLTFGPGETQRAISVPVAWDGLAEGTETVSLALSNPTGGADIAANDAAVLRIADDGASGPLRLSAGSYGASEAGGPVTVTVTRSGGSLGGPVTVDYATADGSATAGSDYTPVTGTLTFGPGETSKSFTVPVLNDSIHESDESFRVVLSNPAGGAALGSPANATVTIADDDPDLSSTPANPNPGGSQTAAADRRAPTLVLAAKAVQKAFKAKLLAVAATCDENCTLSVVAKSGKGRKAVTLGKASAAAARGKKAQLRIKLSKQALAKLAKLLKGGKAQLTLAVVASDAAGNKSRGARNVTVRR